MKRIVQMKVTGRVQGVGFRYYVYNQARSLGVTGYVKNNPDRSVSVFGEADSHIIKMFVEQVKKGPATSRVEKVKLKYYNGSGNYNDFKITG